MAGIGKKKKKNTHTHFRQATDGWSAGLCGCGYTYLKGYPLLFLYSADVVDISFLRRSFLKNTHAQKLFLSTQNTWLPLLCWFVQLLLKLSYLLFKFCSSSVQFQGFFFNAFLWTHYFEKHFIGYNVVTLKYIYVKSSSTSILNLPLSAEPVSAVLDL